MCCCWLFLVSPSSSTSSSSVAALFYVYISAVMIIANDLICGICMCRHLSYMSIKWYVKSILQLVAFWYMSAKMLNLNGYGAWEQGDLYLQCGTHICSQMCLNNMKCFFVTIIDGIDFICGISMDIYQIYYMICQWFNNQ